MNIYLCGMIGSGKTTIGIRLAAEMGREFVDLDQEMDRILGYSFHRLVKEKGWLPFRELEYAICREFSRRDHLIAALGGGTVRYEWNRDILKNSGPMVLLHAPLDVLIERVRVADRPRVNPRVTLEEDVHRIWSESEEKYRAAADLIYDTSPQSIEDAVADLKRMLPPLLQNGRSG